MTDSASSAVDNACRWCGVTHLAPGKCPTVKALEYHPDGSIKRVEFYCPNDYAPMMGGAAGQIYPLVTQVIDPLQIGRCNPPPVYSPLPTTIWRGECGHISQSPN